MSAESYWLINAPVEIVIQNILDSPDESLIRIDHQTEKPKK